MVTTPPEAYATEAKDECDYARSVHWTVYCMIHDLERARSEYGLSLAQIASRVESIHAEHSKVCSSIDCPVIRYKGNPEPAPMPERTATEGTAI